MTPDQAKLLNMAEDSLRAARLLLDNDFPGFAASRAYYAMFTVAQAFLLGKELSFSKHSAVISAFGQHFAKTGIIPREFHRHLLAAQQDRQAGDYGGDLPVSLAGAALHVQHAEEFLNHARKSLGSQGDREQP